MVLGQKALHKKNFGQAPEGYVAGFGRGAAGFTTRSDIGPAKQGPVTGSLGALKVSSAAEPHPPPADLRD